MEKNLILEINRIHQLMGVTSKSEILIEGELKPLMKLFGFADEAFESVEDNKQLLKKLNDLVDEKGGVKKLTQKEINDLADALQAQRNSIKAWAKGSGVPEPGASSKLRGLQQRAVKSGARTANDALLTQRLNKALTNVFEREGSVYGKIYADAVIGTDNELANQIKQLNDFNAITITEKDVIDDFNKQLKSFWESNPKTKGLKFEDYPEFANWARKNFISIDMDDLLEDTRYFSTIDPNTGYPKGHRLKGQRIPKNLEREVINDVGQTTTNLKGKISYGKDVDIYKERKKLAGVSDEDPTITSNSDLKGTVLRNYRFIRNLYKKLQSLFGKDFFESWEKNCALLKGLQAEQITQNGKLTKKFSNLVRQLSYDAEQLSTMTKTMNNYFDELYNELKLVEGGDKLIEHMKKVELYGGWNITWSNETLDAFLERQKMRYTFDESGFVGYKNTWYNLRNYIDDMFKSIKRARESYLTSAKTLNSKITSFADVEIIKILVPEVFFGTVFNPKQIGLMLGRRGYKFIPLLKSFFETWIAMLAWKFILAIPCALAITTIETLISPLGYKMEDFNKEFDFNNDGEPAWTERVWERIVGSYNFKQLQTYIPIDISVSKNICMTLYRNIFGKQDIDGIDVATAELEESANAKQDEIINQMTPEKREELVERLEMTYSSAFSQLSTKLKYKNERPNLTAYKKGLIDDSDCEKLLMARTPTGSIDKAMLSRVANFDFQKNSATLDNVVSVGGFRDKLYNLYVVENKMQGSRSLDTDYLFTRVPYKPKYILQERDPVNDEKYYLLWYYPTAQSSGEQITFARAKSLGLVEKDSDNNIIGPTKTTDGFVKFVTKKGAEENLKKLNDDLDYIVETPISIQEFVKRLSDKPLPPLKPIEPEK
jgi:hypothetical protein